MRPELKHRLVRGGERYLVNPPTKGLLWLGVPMPLCLLETTGRVSGKPRRVPVMNGRVDNTLWIVAEHGHRSAYVRNMLANPKVRVRKGRRWTEGTAHVLDDDDPMARAEWIAGRLGRSKKMEAFATRLLCAYPLTVRVDLAPATETEGKADGDEAGDGEADGDGS